MAKRTLVLILTALVAWTQARGKTITRDTAKVTERLREMPVGTPVELRLHHGPKLRGWVDEVSESGLTLRRESEGRLDVKNLRFDEIDSVKIVSSVESAHIGRKILIGIGVAVGSLLIIGILISDR